MSLDVVRDFVISEFLPGQNPRELDPELPLLSSGVIDSVGTLKLVLFLEETFSVEITAEDIAAGSLESLNSIGRLIESKRDFRVAAG